MRTRRVALLVLALGTAVPRPGRALEIPAWARKYNMNCSGCHYPAVPRLNATGLTFKWAGYRMPDEIGEKVEVQKIEEYLAARVGIQYNYTKAKGEPAAVNGVSVPGASLFVAGPFGKTYGGFVEFEREEEGEVDLTAEVSALWGTTNAYGGVRPGQGHLLVGGAIAGFDRPTGMTAPLPMGEATTAAIPFRFADDIVGLEAFYVLRNRNRLSIRVLNAQPPAEPLGGGAGPPAEEGSASTRQDYAIADQFLWDDAGSGLAVMAYFGSITGLDPDAADRKARYLRVAATANKIVRNVEILGGYVYSRDRDLPVGGLSPLAAPTATGSAYWLSGQVVVPRTPLAVFGRYEFLDPDSDVDDNALRRVVLGGVLPVNLPEYLRLGLELRLDTPQRSAGERRRAAALEVMLAF